MGQTSTQSESTTGSERAAAALRFARRVHLGQHRKQTRQQFVEHPIAVARLLRDAGFGEDVMVAAYLHDVVEKTHVESDEIRLRFGEDAAAVVAALSEDPAIEGYGARKRELRRQVIAAGGTPVLIYAADRVANMRDWLTLPAESRPECAVRLGTTLDERLDLWSEDLDELSALDPELPFLAEIEVDLGTLRREAAPIEA